MIQSNYTVRIIEPSEGFTLTQSSSLDGKVDKVEGKSIRYFKWEVV